VELCEEELPTYYISSEEKILSSEMISHYNFHDHTEKITEGFLPVKNPVRILVTSGASCPDAVVESVISKVISFFPGAESIDKIRESFA
jgi:4-hydroxy-3-methylbut-2-en-1-yl diphosphate reductase